MPFAEHSTATHSPRQKRDRERIRRAAAAARVGPTPAMAVALAQIGAAFDEAATINAFKIRVERLIRLGPYHPAVRARFGARGAMLFGRGSSTRRLPRSSAGGATSARRFRSRAHWAAPPGSRSKYWASYASCCG